MAFLETPRFPTSISLGSRGGPTYSTSIIVIKSGAESRNMNWDYPRHEYDMGYGIKTLDDLEDVIEYFHAIGAMANGFRVKDHRDYKSCRTSQTISDTDQVIGTGDNVEADFQLSKTYTKGVLSRTRIISKPVDATTIISLNGAPQPSGWTVDTETGIVNFDPTVPGAGVTVGAGFEFDVPCRFDIDKLEVILDEPNLASTQIPVIETRDIS